MRGIAVLGMMLTPLLAAGAQPTAPKASGEAAPQVYPADEQVDGGPAIRWVATKGRRQFRCAHGHFRGNGDKHDRPLDRREIQTSDRVAPRRRDRDLHQTAFRSMVDDVQGSARLLGGERVLDGFDSGSQVDHECGDVRDRCVRRRAQT